MKYPFLVLYWIVAIFCIMWVFFALLIWDLKETRANRVAGRLSAFFESGLEFFKCK